MSEGTIALGVFALVGFVKVCLWLGDLLFYVTTGRDEIKQLKAERDHYRDKWIEATKLMAR